MVPVVLERLAAARIPSQHDTTFDWIYDTYLVF